ncbi:MAG: hypothetical protein QOJ07_2417 [Thermoleophilaceae bacterium]|jgi:steroid delta-isomerase-like uncharacterized protein|nr:hypothetical protein [Thermoleophilaceae bacterium]
MTASDATTTTGLDIERLAERYVAAWNGCDVDAMAQLLTDDIVWEDPALPEAAVGIPAVQEFMRTSFRAFPDLHFTEPEPRQMAANGDLIYWSWSMTGTHRGPIEPPGFAATGKRMAVDGVDLWTMRDGRIARYRAFYDMAGLAQQLGIMPAPGTRAERATVTLQRVQARFSR